MGNITLTRKIQLIVDTRDKDEKRKVWETLYSWQRICYRGANFIFTHHFIQEQLKDLFYITEQTKVKLADIRKDEDGILTMSRANTTYRLLSNHFKGEIPTNILSCLNQSLIKYFNKERQAYWKGEKSLRNYKRDIPIPFGASSIRHFKPAEKGKDFSFTLFGLPFRTYFGKDTFDKKALLARAFSTGNVKLCGSSIKLEKKKIFLLAVFQFEKERHELKDEVIAEASLSMEHPIAVTINKAQLMIGNKEEFLYRRLAIQTAVKRAQSGATFNRPGKGRKRKTKSIEKYRKAEKRYVNYKMHVYSRRLIDFCVKKQAGSLLLVNQSAKEEAAKEDKFLLRNWSYYGLKDKIAYKASKAGITLIEE